MLIALRPNSAPAMVPSTEMPVCSLASDACCACAWICCSARRMRSVSVAIFGANFCRSRSFSASRVSRSFSVTRARNAASVSSGCDDSSVAASKNSVSTCSCCSVRAESHCSHAA